MVAGVDIKAITGTPGREIHRIQVFHKGDPRHWGRGIHTKSLKFFDNDNSPQSSLHRALTHSACVYSGGFFFAVCLN